MSNSQTPKLNETWLLFIALFYNGDTIAHGTRNLSSLPKRQHNPNYFLIKVPVCLIHVSISRLPWFPLDPLPCTFSSLTWRAFSSIHKYFFLLFFLSFWFIFSPSRLLFSLSVLLLLSLFSSVSVCFPPFFSYYR